MPNTKKKPKLLINFPLYSISEVETALQHLVSVGGNDRDRKYRGKLMDILMDSKDPWFVFDHLRELQDSHVSFTKVVGVQRLKRLATAIIHRGNCYNAIELLRYLKPQESFVNERIVTLKKILRYPKDVWMKNGYWEGDELVPEERAMLIETVRRSGTLQHARTLQSSMFGITSEQAQEVQELIKKLESKTSQAA